MKNVKNRRRKRKAKRKTNANPSANMNIFDRLPLFIVNEILQKLDLESLCSVTSTCRLLHFCASQVLTSLQTLDLTEFFPDLKTLRYLVFSNNSLRKLMINCIRLDDSAFEIFSAPHVEELRLLKCVNFSPRVFVLLGERCPNLRSLAVESIYCSRFGSLYYSQSLEILCTGCPCLKSICIKIEGLPPPTYEVLTRALPATINNLSLKTVKQDFISQMLYYSTNYQASPGKVPLGVTFQGVQCLALVVDQITDHLLSLITQNLFCLVNLELQDAPLQQPLPQHDVSNTGVQSLRSCHKLSQLSLIRSRECSPAFFNAVNDVGMFLLAEGCINLESLKLGGFRRVTDAGFNALLQSCKHLQNFELCNTFHLSDLAFHDLFTLSHSLLSLRLISCNLLTSESMAHVVFCENLELLDLSGCKSIADDGVKALSKLRKLSVLSLSGADVTDFGMSLLGEGNAPLVSLSLRGCRRVSDQGVSLLLRGALKKTLRRLDFGYMPAISDKAIKTLIKVGIQLVELSVRNCFSVTDKSVVALSGKSIDDSVKRSVKRLDFYNCKGLSVMSLQRFGKPFFPGLKWLGVGSTALSSSLNIDEVTEERPSLRICLLGCEMGCYDRWKNHQDSQEM